MSFFLALLASLLPCSFISTLILFAHSHSIHPGSLGCPPLLRQPCLLYTPFPDICLLPLDTQPEMLPLLRLPSSSSRTPSSTTQSFVSYFTISTMSNSHTSVFTGARPCLLMARHLHNRFEPAWLTWCCCCLWVFPNAFQTWIWVDLTVQMKNLRLLTVTKSTDHQMRMYNPTHFLFNYLLSCLHIFGCICMLAHICTDANPVCVCLCMWACVCVCMCVLARNWPQVSSLIFLS